MGAVSAPERRRRPTHAPEAKRRNHNLVVILTREAAAALGAASEGPQLCSTLGRAPEASRGRAERTRTPPKADARAQGEITT